MTYQAQIVRVLIASPSDVMEERDAVEATLHRWNAEHSESTGAVLLPVRWESAATAESGDRPQAIVNRQIVDSADVLIGIFWTRLGTPTGMAQSGTAEEIKRFKDAGKPVSLYFSDRPVAPGTIDSDQLASMNKLKQDERAAGIVGDFTTPDELARQVAAAMTRVIHQRFGVTGPSVTTLKAPHAHVSASTAGSNIRLINDGAGEASDVTVTTSGPGDSEGWDLMYGDEPLEYLAAGQAIEYRTLLHMGSPLRVNCYVRWKNEDGTSGTSRQTLQRV